MVASQSQLQTTQHHHNFVLQKVNCNDAEDTAVFAKPTLRCNLTEFMSSDSQGLIALRLQIVWTLGEPEDTTADQASRFTQQLAQVSLDGQRAEPNRRYLSIEDIDLCSFANRKASGPSSIDDSGPPPLRGQQQGRIVALRYRSPPHSQNGFRHLQCKFQSEQDALAFVAVVENVCPIIRAAQPKAGNKPPAKAITGASQPAPTPMNQSEPALPTTARLDPPSNINGAPSDTMLATGTCGLNFAQSQRGLEDALREIDQDAFMSPHFASPLQRQVAYNDAGNGQHALELESQASVIDANLRFWETQCFTNENYSRTPVAAPYSNVRTEHVEHTTTMPSPGQRTNAAFAHFGPPMTPMQSPQKGAFAPLKEEIGSAMVYEQKEIDASMAALWSKSADLPGYADKILKSPWFPIVMDALAASKDS